MNAVDTNILVYSIDPKEVYSIDPKEIVKKQKVELLLQQLQANPDVTVMIWQVLLKSIQ